MLLSLVTVSKWKCFKKTAEKSNFINNNTVNNDTNKLVETMLNGTAKNYLSLLHSQGIYKVFNNCLNIHLNNHKLILTAQNLTSILTLSVQILTSSSYLPNVLNDFSSEILTVPTVIKELLTLKTQPQAETILIECNLSCRLYPMLSKRNEDLTNSSNSSSFIEGMNFLQGVSFLGNLCSIELLDFDSFKLNVHNFLVIATQIIEHCSKLLLSSTDQTKNTLINCDSTTNSEMIITWTPLFGYLKLKLSNSLCFNDLLEQLRFLWSHKFILLLFFESPDTLLQISAANEQQAKKELNLKSLMRSLFDKSSSLQQKQQLNTSHIVFRICSFYKKILVLMSEPKIEILCSLSFEEEFLLGIWKYFCTLEVKELVKIIDKDKCFTHPIFDVLYVLASLILYLFTIFDEEEVFTQQKFLTRDDFRKLASFLNQFLYEIVVSMAQTEANLEKNNYFVLWHELLLVIYDKDCKQSTREQMEQFWVIKDIKIKSFMNDLSRGKANSSILLSRMPHVIPLKHRIEIMQAEIVRDKERLEYANVRIKVRRNRIIEDGIDQINGLPSLKSTIRVKMINEHGLNEAGIDQDGVFKEFLLDVIKKILNPEFNLFQLTDEQQVYPSSCSYFMDDHLNMFEFVGKLIGKAVYEGHVIDVQFAPFFLRQIIGGCNNSNYSFVDDLASLDKQLYKNLRSIRSCDQVDVLELTFTHSEMHLGQLVTNELVPGGSDIKVLNDNKIRYIHLLAHFKLHKQIRQQIIAFNKGFKSIIKQDWLNSFTLNEIQTLISGSTVDLDCDDLKDNVQYWGGLHAQHRLIKWLWDIIEFDFNRNERALFLKFVTSSARPPLLGFSSLNPQFTIRSVENEEEDGTIYDASFKGIILTTLFIKNNIFILNCFDFKKDFLKQC